MPAPENLRTEADAIAEIARKSNDTKLVGPDDFIVPFAHNPAWGNQALDLEKFLDAPVRKRATFNALTSDAFIYYVGLHRTHGTVLTGMVTTQGGSFACELDGHEPNIYTKAEVAAEVLQAFVPADQITEGQPSWRTHRADLVLRPSPEWEKWLGLNGKTLDQAAFAEFLEDNVADITVPDGTTFPDAAMMMTTATTLEAKTEVQFSSGLRLQNGTQQLVYSENVNGQVGGEARLAIPDKFAVALAPFIGAPKYQVIARLRYFLSRGKVSFRYELERPYKVIEDAYKAEANKISTALSLPVLLGKLS